MDERNHENHIIYSSFSSRLVNAMKIANGNCFHSSLGDDDDDDNIAVVAVISFITWVIFLLFISFFFVIKRHYA